LRMSRAPSLSCRALRQRYCAAAIPPPVIASFAPTPRPPRSPLFPYTTLFRSRVGDVAGAHLRAEDVARAVLLRRQAVGSRPLGEDRKSTRLNSSHVSISYAVFCLKKNNRQYRPESTDKSDTLAEALMRPADSS